MCRSPTMSADNPAASDGVPVVSHTRHPVGIACPPPAVAFLACVSTRAPLRWRPGHCPQFHAPIQPATLTDCPALSDMRGAMSPRPVVRGPMAIALPRSCSPVPSPRPFWARHRPLCRSSSRHRPGTAPCPAGDRPSPFAPPLAIQFQSHR